MERENKNNKPRGSRLSPLSHIPLVQDHSRRRKPNNNLGQHAGLAQLRGCSQQPTQNALPQHALPPLKKTTQLQHVVEPIKRMSDEEIQAQAATEHRQSPVGSLQKRPRDKRPRLKPPTHENLSQGSIGKSPRYLGKPENIHALGNPHLMDDLLTRSSHRRVKSLEGYVASVSPRKETAPEPELQKQPADLKPTLSKQLLKVNELSKKYQKSRTQISPASEKDHDGENQTDSKEAEGCGDDCDVTQPDTYAHASEKFADVDGVCGRNDIRDDDYQSIPEELTMAEYESWMVSRGVSSAEDVASDEALAGLPADTVALNHLTLKRHTCNSIHGNVMVDVATLRSLGLESLAAEMTQAKNVSEELYEAKMDDILSGRRPVEIKGFCGSLDSLLCLYDELGRQQQHVIDEMRREMDSEEDEYGAEFNTEQSQLTDDEENEESQGKNVQQNPQLSQKHDRSTQDHHPPNGDSNVQAHQQENQGKENANLQQSGQCKEHFQRNKQIQKESQQKTKQPKQAACDGSTSKKSLHRQQTYKQSPLRENGHTQSIPDGKGKKRFPLDRQEKKQTSQSRETSKHSSRDRAASKQSPECETADKCSQPDGNGNKQSSHDGQEQKQSPHSVKTSKQSSRDRSASKESPHREKAKSQLPQGRHKQAKCIGKVGKESPHKEQANTQVPPREETNKQSPCDQHAQKHTQEKGRSLSPHNVEPNQLIFDGSVPQETLHAGEILPVSCLSNDEQVQQQHSHDEHEQQPPHADRQEQDESVANLRQANDDTEEVNVLQTQRKEPSLQDPSTSVDNIGDTYSHPYCESIMTDDCTEYSDSEEEGGSYTYEDSAREVKQQSHNDNSCTSCEELEEREADDTDKQKCDDSEQEQSAESSADEESEDTESTKNIMFLWQENHITINSARDFSSNNHKTKLEEQKDHLKLKVKQIEEMLDQLLLERDDLASKCSSTELEMILGEVQIKNLESRVAILTSPICVKTDTDTAPGSSREGDAGARPKSLGMEGVNQQLIETERKVQMQKDQVESLTSDIEEFHLQLNLDVSEEDWREDRDQELIALKRRVSELENNTLACAELEARYKENMTVLQQQLYETRLLRLSQSAIKKSNEKLREEIELTKKDSKKKIKALSEDLADMEMNNVMLTDSLQDANEAREKAEQKEKHKSKKLTEIEDLCDSAMNNIKELTDSDREVADLIGSGYSIPAEMSTATTTYSSDVSSGSSSSTKTSSSTSTTSSSSTCKASSSSSRKTAVLNAAIQSIKSLKEVIRSAVTDSDQFLKSEEDEIEEDIVEEIEEIEDIEHVQSQASAILNIYPFAPPSDVDRQLHLQHVNDALQHLDVLLKMKFEICLTFISDLNNNLKQSAKGQKDTVDMLKKMFSWVFEEEIPEENYAEKIGEAREKIKRIKARTEQVRCHLENDYSNLMEQKRVLQCKHEILQQQLEDKTQCYNMLKERFAELDSQHLKLQASHEDAAAEKERLSVEIQKLAHEKERVLSEQKRSFSKLQQLDDDYDEKHRVLQEAFNKVADEKDALKNKIRILERDKQELLTSSEESLKQLSEHDRDRQIMQDAFDDLLLEKQTLVRRIHALEKEKQDALNTQETWRTKFRKLDDEYEEKHKALQEAFNRVSEEKDKLKSRTVNLEKENRELMAKEEAVEEEFNKLKELYNQEHSSREEVIHKLLQEKDVLQKSINSLQQKDQGANNADLAKKLSELHSQHERELQTLRATHDKTLGEKEGLERTVEMLERQLSAMREAEDKSKAKFLDMQDSQGVLEAHYEEEKEELEKTIKKLKSENSIIFDGQDEWRKKVQQLDDQYQEDHERMQAALDKVNEEKDALYKQIQILQTERKDLIHTQEGMHEQIEHYEQGRKALLDSFTQISEDKEALQMKIERLEKQIVDSDHDVSVWDDREAQYKHDNEVLQEVLERVSAEKDALMSKIKAMERELGELQKVKGSLNSLSEEKLGLQEKISDLELEVLELSDTNKAWGTKEEKIETEHAKELQTLKETLERVTLENARLESWVNEMEHRKEEHTDSSEMLDTKIQQLEGEYREELKSLKESLDKVTKEKDLLAKQLEQKQHTFNTVEMEWKEKFQKLEARYEEDAEDLHASFREVAEEKDTYKDRICNIDDMWKHKVQQLQEQQQEEKYEYEEKLEEANEVRYGLEDEIAALKREKHAMQHLGETWRKNIQMEERAELKKVLNRMDEMHQTNFIALHNDMEKVVNEKEVLLRKIERLKKNQNPQKKGQTGVSDDESFDDVYDQDNVVTVFSMKNSSGESTEQDECQCQKQKQGRGQNGRGSYGQKRKQSPRRQSTQGSQTVEAHDLHVHIPHVDAIESPLVEIQEEADVAGVDEDSSSDTIIPEQTWLCLPSQDKPKTKSLSKVDEHADYHEVSSKTHFEHKKGVKKVRMASDSYQSFKEHSDEKLKIRLASNKSLQLTGGQSNQMLGYLQETQEKLVNEKQILQTENEMFQRDKQQLEKDKEQLEKENEQLEIQVQSLEKQLQLSKQELQKISSSNENETSSYEEMVVYFEKEKVDITDCEERYRALLKVYKSLKKEKRELQNRVQFLEKQVSEMLAQNHSEGNSQILTFQSSSSSEEMDSYHSLQQDYDAMLEEKIGILENQKQHLKEAKFCDDDMKRTMVQLHKEKEYLEKKVHDVGTRKELRLLMESESSVGSVESLPTEQCLQGDYNNSKTLEEKMNCLETEKQREAQLKQQVEMAIQENRMLNGKIYVLEKEKQELVDIFSEDIRLKESIEKLMMKKPLDEGWKDMGKTEKKDLIRSMCNEIILESMVGQLMADKQQLEDKIRKLEDLHHYPGDNRPPLTYSEKPPSTTGIPDQYELKDSWSKLKQENQMLVKRILCLSEEKEEILKKQQVRDDFQGDVAKLREEKQMYENMVHTLQREKELNKFQSEELNSLNDMYMIGQTVPFGTPGKLGVHVEPTLQYDGLLREKQRLEEKVRNLEQERQQLLSTHNTLQHSYKQLEQQKLERRVHLLEDERQDLLSALETWQENFKLLELKLDQQMSRQLTPRDQDMSQPISSLFEMFKQIITQVVNLTNAQNSSKENDKLADELHSLVQLISIKLQHHANEGNQRMPSMHAHYETLILNIEQEYERRLKTAEQKLHSFNRNQQTKAETSQSDRITQLSTQIANMKKVMQEVIQDTARQYYRQHDMNMQKMEAQRDMEMEVQRDKIRKLERARNSAIDKQIRTQGKVDELKHQLHLKVQELSEITRALHKTSTLFEDLKGELERETLAKEQLESKINEQVHQLRERDAEVREYKAKTSLLEQKLEDQKQEKINVEENAKYEISSLKHDISTLRNGMKDEKEQMLRQLRRTKKRLSSIETNKDMEIDMLTSRLKAANEILLKLRRDTLQDLEDCQQKRSRFHDYVDMTRKMTLRKTVEAWVPETVTPFNNLSKLTEQLGEIERLHNSINETIQTSKKLPQIQSTEEVDFESNKDGDTSCGSLDSIVSET